VDKGYPPRHGQYGIQCGACECWTFYDLIPGVCRNIHCMNYGEKTHEEDGVRHICVIVRHDHEKDEPCTCPKS
jgi:hypothetical protein